MEAKTEEKGTTDLEPIKYQIEATIEKFSQDGIQLKGIGKYLFEKSKEKDNDKKYWNIFEWKKSDEETATEQGVKQPEKPPISVKHNQLIYFDGIFKDLLISAFIEKKSLKFVLDDKFTITAVSHVST